MASMSRWSRSCRVPMLDIAASCLWCVEVAHRLGESEAAAAAGRAAVPQRRGVRPKARILVGQKSYSGAGAGSSLPNNPWLSPPGPAVKNSEFVEPEFAFPLPNCRAQRPSIFFFFKQKTAYEIGLGIPAEPLFRSDKTLQVGYANHFYRSAHKFEQICRHRLRRQNVGYSNFSQPQSHLSFCVLLQYLVERRRVVTQLGKLD